jgi:hypothetical protein
MRENDGEALFGMPVAAVLIRFDRFDSIAEGEEGGGGPRDCRHRWDLSI